MPVTKQSVSFDDEMAIEIQTLYLKIHRTMRGAMQSTLARGAELALAELRQIANSDAVLQGGDKAPIKNLYTKSEVSDNLTGAWAKRVKAVLDSGQKDAITTLDYVLKACEVLAGANNAISTGVSGHQSAAHGRAIEDLVRRAEDHTRILEGLTGGHQKGEVALSDTRPKAVRNKRGA